VTFKQLVNVGHDRRFYTTSNPAVSTLVGLRSKTSLVYRSGEQNKGMFAPIKGDHPGDVVRDLNITVESVPPY
jgi:hypothetical protein